MNCHCIVKGNLVDQVDILQHCICPTDGRLLYIYAALSMTPSVIVLVSVTQQRQLHACESVCMYVCVQLLELMPALACSVWWSDCVSSLPQQVTPALQLSLCA